jgi:hypothetical protein
MANFAIERVAEVVASDPHDFNSELKREGKGK